MHDVTMGSRLKQRRKRLGLTQEELAEKVDVSVNHISAVENSKENLSINLLLKLCECLNTTPDYVLLGTSHSQSDPDRLIETVKLCDSNDIALLTHMAEYLIRNK